MGLNTNLIGNEVSRFRLTISRSGTGIQSNTKWLSKPPYVISEPVRYSNVSSDTTSITGHGIVFLNRFRFLMNVF